MVRHDQTAPLMCVMVAVGVVALVMSAGERPDRRIRGLDEPEAVVLGAPATAGAIASFDFPYTEQSHGHQ